jgi:hypothetical protein
MYQTQSEYFEDHLKTFSFKTLFDLYIKNPSSYYFPEYAHNNKSINENRNYFINRITHHCEIKQRIESAQKDPTKWTEELKFFIVVNEFNLIDYACYHQEEFDYTKGINNFLSILSKLDPNEKITNDNKSGLEVIGDWINYLPCTKKTLRFIVEQVSKQINKSSVYDGKSTNLNTLRTPFLNKVITSLNGNTLPDDILPARLTREVNGLYLEVNSLNALCKIVGIEGVKPFTTLDDIEISRGKDNAVGGGKKLNKNCCTII